MVLAFSFAFFAENIMTDDLKKLFPFYCQCPQKYKSPSSGPEAANRCNSKSESRKQNPQISGIDKSLSEFPCLSFQDYLSYTLFLSSIILFFNLTRRIFSTSERKDPSRLHPRTILTPGFPSSHHSCNEKSMIYTHQEMRYTYAAYHK